MSDVTLPTAEEIHQLPEWAQLTFAAHCARLAFPNFLKYWPKAPQKHVEDVERAISLTEQAAKSMFHLNTAFINLADKARIAADYATRAKNVAPTAVATAAALSAAAAATATAASSFRPNAHAAAEAATHAANAGVPKIAIHQLFQRLLEECHQHQLAGETVIPPTVFDPYRHKSSVIDDDMSDPTDSSGFRLILDSFAAEGVDLQDVRKRLVTLFRQLNEYSLLRWGKGLTIDEFKQYLLAGVPAEVPS